MGCILVILILILILVKSNKVYQLVLTGKVGGISATIYMKIAKLPIFVEHSCGGGWAKKWSPTRDNPDKYV